MIGPLAWISVAALFPLVATVFAGETARPAYNLVELQAEAQREVQNDLVNATLYIERNDASPSALADAMNQGVNNALRVAKDYATVRVRSGNSQTFPVYAKDNVLQGWRGRAEIRVESKDFEAASSLIGRLQSGMQLASMNFVVSPEARRAAENELIAEAITAFKARAAIIEAALAGRDYRLQRLTLNSSYNAPVPRFERSLAVAAAPTVAAPNLEAGVSRVTVTAQGAIEIIQ